MSSRLSRLLLPSALFIAFVSSPAAFAAQSTEHPSAQKAVSRADAPAGARQSASDASAAQPANDAVATAQKGRNVQTLDGPICELWFDYDWWTGSGEVAYIKYLACVDKHWY